MPTTRSQAKIQEIEKKHAEEIRLLKAKSEEKVKNLKHSLDELEKRVQVYEERFQGLDKVLDEYNMYELRTGIEKLYRDWYC